MLIKDAVKQAVEPYVGAIVADTCVRATALAMGKTADDLDTTDLPKLESSIRHLLSPVAPPAVIDAAVASMKQSILVEV